jgi:hypothetical protein
LGRGYRVIDKAASIKFVKLGKTTLYAEFRLTPDDIHAIKADLEGKEKMDW